ncbi:MAG TPA: flavin reductase family protein [Streptosporangiaceae bacterium]
MSLVADEKTGGYIQMVDAHSLETTAYPPVQPLSDFRLGMQRLPRGVSIITAVAADGKQYGITATAVFSLSLDPPSLVAGVNKRTRLGKTLYTASGFAVSILGTGHRDVAEAFAGKRSELRGADRFAYGEWRRDSTGVPILGDAPACFICKVDDIIERSTHLLLIGVVTKVYVADRDIAPLVYFSRTFTCVGGDSALAQVRPGSADGL